MGLLLAIAAVAVRVIGSEVVGAMSADSFPGGWRV